MKDVASLLIATTMLAVGGLGLFLYGNRNETSDNDPEIYKDDNYDNSDDYYNDEDEYNNNNNNTLNNYFSGFWNNDKNETTEDEPNNEIKIKENKSKKSKTIRQRKNIGSKRRY